jgi:hypothetical protein
VSTYGKYRGVVQNNDDPMELGRVQALVPDLSHELLAWALPCLPSAGPYAVPAVGASIWVEFEGGDLDSPIWSGCFWNVGEAPPFEVP